MPEGCYTGKATVVLALRALSEGEWNERALSSFSIQRRNE